MVNSCSSNTLRFTASGKWSLCTSSDDMSSLDYICLFIGAHHMPPEGNVSVWSHWFAAQSLLLFDWSQQVGSQQVTVTMEMCVCVVCNVTGVWLWADGWHQMETTWCVAAVRPAVVSRDGRDGWRQMSVRFTGATRHYTWGGTLNTVSVFPGLFYTSPAIQLSLTFIVLTCFVVIVHTIL